MGKDDYQEEQNRSKFMALQSHKTRRKIRRRLLQIKGKQKTLTVSEDI